MIAVSARVVKRGGGRGGGQENFKTVVRSQGMYVVAIYSTHRSAGLSAMRASGNESVQKPYSPLPILVLTAGLHCAVLPATRQDQH